MASRDQRLPLWPAEHAGEAEAVELHALVRQAAVVGYVERGQRLGKGLRDDQRRVVGRDRHPFGKAIPSATWRTDPSGDERDDPGRELPRP
jgi:hypothetical protein